MLKSWREIRVGDLVRVSGEGALAFFPCDMTLVHSSGEDGFCYVQTKSLDGETNLKLKKAHPDLYQNYKNDISFVNFRGEVECAAPNNELYRCDVSVK